jgi:hypothetical protein
VEQFTIKHRPNKKPLRLKVFDAGKKTEVVLLYDHSSIKMDMRDVEWLRSLLVNTEVMNK